MCSMAMEQEVQVAPRRSRVAVNFCESSTDGGVFFFWRIFSVSLSVVIIQDFCEGGNWRGWGERGRVEEGAASPLAAAGVPHLCSAQVRYRAATHARARGYGLTAARPPPSSPSSATSWALWQGGRRALQKQR